MKTLRNIFGNIVHRFKPPFEPDDDLLLSLDADIHEDDGPDSEEINGL